KRGTLLLAELKSLVDSFSEDQRPQVIKLVDAMLSGMTAGYQTRHSSNSRSKQCTRLSSIQPDRRRLMNKVILITGASTGLGRTAAETLAKRGYRVFATMRDSLDRNASTAEALRSLANANRWNLDVLELDVTNDTSVGQAVHHVLDRAGRIDVVINN